MGLVVHGALMFQLIHLSSFQIVPLKLEGTPLLRETLSGTTLAYSPWQIPQTLLDIKYQKLTMKKQFHM